MEKAQEKVDFIIGREIEIGGIYKGIVASVKEYGAFVEFNGGQQGLLHISELVSDLVSIGQELSLMCIGQDVRGNIKLSLKAASSLPGSDRRNADVKDSVTPTKPTHNVWTSVENVSNCQEMPSSIFGESSIGKDEDQADTAMHSLPSILIRSAAECDAQESLSDQCFSKKTDKTVKSSTISKSSLSSRKKLTNPVPLKQNSNKKEVEDNSEDENGHSATSHSSVAKNANYTLKGSHAGGASAKSLRLGDRLTVKVYQIRAHGLVLELGGGIRGMYRFEGNGKRDFKVGEELRVQCSSFSSKGIPVMSLLDDML
ncbi:polyribonucleotide nucleotidyltransferase 2, mitochondrial isoform X1 [Cinnamomum micranthum f. kanehirae]|uniref:Polyribonucleotide nucleotidyltransferase 2, mitochondrial isoform X1 n=1 Tax=Cinnamomum micranthum f. kanehirae TaxID=337451 RepID=A0A3S3PJ90_9MAGN|nr:polyribonucleotide nucleotidyltransferase 2, mitochondrial isoform X1 [Cinnamomum micranthum f. kanehirae]